MRGRGAARRKEGALPRKREEASFPRVHPPSPRAHDPTKPHRPPPDSSAARFGAVDAACEKTPRLRCGGDQPNAAAPATHSLPSPETPYVRKCDISALRRPRGSPRQSRLGG